MRIINLLLILILVGCATDAEKRVHKYDEQFEDVKEKDFNNNTPQKYVQKRDYHPVKIRKDLAGFLKETFSVLPASDLDKVVVKNDKVSDISKLCHGGDISDGLGLAKKTFEKLQLSPSYWTVLGNCYQLKGNHFLAQMYYSKSLSMRSNNSAVYNNYGVSLVNDGKKDRAMVAFNKAIKLNSNHLTARLNLAMLYTQYGVHDKAIEHWQYLNRMMPRSELVFSGLGSSYLMKGKYKTAVSYLSKIKNKENADPMVNLALAQAMMGRRKTALKILDRISTYPNKNWKLYKNSVSKYLERKK